MKKLAYIIIIASCLVGCSKCKKDHEATLIGEVIDQTTRNPISNVKVFLIGSTTSLGGNPGYTELQNVTTGSDGRYAISYKGALYDHYYVIAKPFEPYKYYSNSSTNDLLPVSFNNGNNTKDIELLHCGYIKVNLHHTSADTITDIWMGSNGQAMYTTNGVKFTYYVPNYIDNTTYVFCLESNRTNLFNIYVTKKMPNGTGYSTDSVRNFYTVPHDTIYYQFNY
jgi:hypothetical protein